MLEVFPQHFHFLLGQHEVIVPVHEHKRRLEQLRVRQPHLFLLLNFHRRRPRYEPDQILPHSAAIVPVVLAVLDPTQEKCRQRIARLLRVHRDTNQRHAHNQFLHDSPQRFSNNHSADKPPSNAPSVHPFIPNGFCTTRLRCASSTFLLIAATISPPSRQSSTFNATPPLTAAHWRSVSMSRAVFCNSTFTSRISIVRPATELLRASTTVAV